MIEVRKTDAFLKWIANLRDERAKAKIAARIDRIAFGNFGDVKPVGEGISELRIQYGQGYRVYFTKIANNIIILLCGGDKSTQQNDIKEAKKIAKDFNE